MFGRIPLYNVRSLDELADVVGASPGEKVIITDVDNTLVPRGVPPEEFATVANAAIDELQAQSRVARVIALTNGPARCVPRVMSRGNKPWTSRRRLGLRGRRVPIVVVGDQVLTDGLLAWRLRATYVQLVIDDQGESRWQATMRRIGRVVSGALFRPVATAPPSHSEESS